VPRQLLVGLLVLSIVLAIAVVIVYVGWGGDALTFGLEHEQTRERVRLVLAAFAALAAPLSATAAWLAFDMNRRQMRLNLDARLAPVPATEPYIDAVEQLRFADGHEVDVAQCQVYVPEPADGRWRCAVPVLNTGPGIAILGDASLTVGTARLSGSWTRPVIASEGTAFALFAGAGDDVAGAGQALRQAGGDAELVIGYTTALGTKSAFTTILRGSGSSWQLTDVGVTGG
jgi:hypothetical protein